MNSLILRLSALDYQKTFILGVVLGAFYYFTIFDSGANVEAALQDMNNQVSVEEQKQKEAERAKKQAEKLKADVIVLSDQYKAISTQIPTDLQISEVFKNIDAIGNAAGVTIKQREPLKDKDKNVDIVERIPIRVVAEGNYGELVLFVYNMVSSERIIRIHAMKITKIVDPQRGNAVANMNKKKPLSMDIVFDNYRFVGEAKQETVEKK